MSIPKDVSSGSTMIGESRPRPEGRLSAQQRGLTLAALVAFLGVAYVGPALGRMIRKPRLEDRIAVRLRTVRKNARRAGGKAQKKLRRLGGGPIRR